MTTILTVGDNHQAQSTVEEVLTGEGYAVTSTSNYQQTLFLVTDINPDLIVIDVQNSLQTVVNVCEQIREMPAAQSIPILFIMPPHTGAKEAASLLDAGGDDLLKQPIANQELAARTRAVLRRANKLGYPTAVRLNLDPNENTVYVNQRRVDLTPMEFELLSYLCEHRTTFHTAPDLLQSLWNYPPKSGDTALVRNHIRNLRRKLEVDPDHPHVLISQYGRGYTIRAVVQQA